MNLWERVLAAGGLVLMLFSIVWHFPSSSRRHDEVIVANGCRVPVLVLEPTQPERDISVVVFHGLSANRRIMQLTGWPAGEGARTYLVDLPGHGNNAEPFSFERAEECAAAVVGALEKQGKIRLERTVLLGHSMGANIAIRLADRFPTAATIAISSSMVLPLPEKPSKLHPQELPRRIPVNLLLFHGQFDLPTAKATSERILQAASGERFAPEDFRQKRAVRLVRVKRASHTSLLLDPEVTETSRDWLRSTFNLETARTVPLPAGSALGLLLINSGAPILLFPALATWLCRRARINPEADVGSRASLDRAALAWAVVALMAVALQYRQVTLAPAVRLYCGDYFASVLFVSGAFLLLFQRVWAPQPSASRRWLSGAAGVAALLGLLSIAGMGAWLNWQATDLWLNAARGWRFAALIPLLLPYALAEEMALGAAPADPATFWRRILIGDSRIGMTLLLRSLLWLAMCFGLYVLHSGEVLVVLLVIYLVGFSVVQRMGMDAIRRRTGSATAAALFGAILGAWLIAALFPIT